MISALIQALLPRQWSGEQALAVVRILREANDAIWEVHGEKMVEDLRQPDLSAVPWHLRARAGLPSDLGDLDDLDELDPADFDDIPDEDEIPY